jgi:hypothetical protein
MQFFSKGKLFSRLQYRVEMYFFQLKNNYINNGQWSKLKMWLTCVAPRLNSNDVKKHGEITMSFHNCDKR